MGDDAGVEFEVRITFSIQVRHYKRAASRRMSCLREEQEALKRMKEADRVEVRAIVMGADSDQALTTFA